MLTRGQHQALDALCRTIVPAAFEHPLTADLPARVAERVGELTPYQRKRALLALTLFHSRALSTFLIGKPVGFDRLTARDRGLLLERCATHRLALVRLLFSSVRRLVLHTHYGRVEARQAIGHPGPLYLRASEFPWEGPISGAAPVVAAAERGRVRERVVPAGVVEHPSVDTHIRTRVCIIGSGVGGATAAAILAEAGHDVVVVEEGGYFSAADFGDDETAALHTLYADHGLRSTDALNVSILQGRCAGGGSTVNWMVMLRTPDHVLDEWQREHGTEGMQPRDLAAVFDEFERANGVGPVAAHAHSRINRLILDSSAQLGWHAHGASVNARECMRTGLCGLGCPYDAKQGALLTTLPRAFAAGTRLFCNTAVQRLERMRDGWRVHADRMVVDCDVVIVAAGAVGTPTLLQRSGVACGGVGQHLRFHPTTAVLGLYDEPFLAATGIPLTAYCDEFTHRSDGYGHWIEAPPLTAGLASVALPGFGATHERYMKQFRYFAPLIVLTRDGAPAGPSRGSVRAFGSGVRIHYRLGTEDRKIMQHGLESAARMHVAAGARAILTLHGHETVLRTDHDLHLIGEATGRYGDPALFSAHVNGTCRIGRTPDTSGCRPDGQVHGQKGLYVMDGSLLPTAPGVNPHETIAAVTTILASRLAEAMPRAD